MLRCRVVFKRRKESTELTEFSDMFSLFLRALYKKEIAYIQNTDRLITRLYSDSDIELPV